MVLICIPTRILRTETGATGVEEVVVIEEDTVGEGHELFHLVFVNVLKQSGTQHVTQCKWVSYTLHTVRVNPRRSDNHPTVYSTAELKPIHVLPYFFSLSLPLLFPK